MIICINETAIDFKSIQDIIYWSKKWEISAYQLMEASYIVNSSCVRVIEEYLRQKGFAV